MRFCFAWLLAWSLSYCTWATNVPPALLSFIESWNAADPDAMIAALDDAFLLLRLDQEPITNRPGLEQYLRRHFDGDFAPYQAITLAPTTNAWQEITPGLWSGELAEQQVLPTGRRIDLVLACSASLSAEGKIRHLHMGLNAYKNPLQGRSSGMWLQLGVMAAATGFIIGGVLTFALVSRTRRGRPKSN